MTPQDLDQYVMSAEDDGSFYCGICNHSVSQMRKDNLRRHIESKHFPNVFSYQCSECYLHSVIFPRGVVHRVENGWGLTKVAVVLLNGLLW